MNDMFIIFIFFPVFIMFGYLLHLFANKVNLGPFNPILTLFSKLSVIIHEMSHLLLRTKDHSYNPDTCRSYAKSNPNNAVENAIRPFVVGRKNWLFSNTPRGAHSSAVIYSLIETAKANDLEPYRYLRYLFTHLPKTSSKKELRSLLPHNVDSDVIKSC